MKKKLSVVNYQLSILLILAAFLSPLTMRADSAAQLAAKINKFSVDYGAATRFIARASGDTVTVVGVLSEVTAMLSINIDANVTVQWQAEISNASTFPSGYALISLSGTGRFEVIRGGVAATGDNVRAIVISGVTLAVSGGTISATTYSAIFSGNESSKVIISGGTVSSAGTTIYGSSSTLTVSGGTVSSTADVAIYVATDDLLTVGGDALVKTTGDKSAAILSLGSVNVQDNAQVSATTGYAIYSRGVNVTTTISGGTVGVTTGTAILADSKNSMITVSGTGQVQATENYGYAINTSGNVEVKDNAQVSATTGNAIDVTGDNSTVTVSGGIVSATTGLAIYTEGGHATVTVNGGTVSATTGEGIDTNSSDASVMVSGAGQVQVTGNGGYALLINGKLEVKDNAKVNSVTGYAIYAGSSSSSTTVSGNAQVQATGDAGTAIFTYGSVEVKDNATVSATTGEAIYTSGASSAVIVSGGLVFAYGSAIIGYGNVISSGNNSFTGATGTGVVIAWNKAAGHTTYTAGSSDDIAKSPASATVVWGKNGTDSGISYANGANSGFIHLPVTINSPYLSVSPDSWNVDASGGTKIFSISSNINWSVSISGAGILVTPPLGSGDGNITVTVPDNQTTSQRTTTITISGTGVTAQTIIVTQDAAAPTKYMLIVNNGTGGGSYTEGTIVSISATAAPSGKEFDKWTGDVGGVADVEAANTTYTMGNANAIITATYKDIDKTALQTVETPSLMIFSQNGNLRVESNTLAIQSVFVYAVSGKILKIVEPESNRAVVNGLPGSQALIVKVVRSDGTTITKKIINR